MNNDASIHRLSLSSKRLMGIELAKVIARASARAAAPCTAEIYIAATRCASSLSGIPILDAHTQTKLVLAAALTAVSISLVISLLCICRLRVNVEVRASRELAVREVATQTAVEDGGRDGDGGGRGGSGGEVGQGGHRPPIVYSPPPLSFSFRSETSHRPKSATRAVSNGTASTSLPHCAITNLAFYNQRESSPTP